MWKVFFFALMLSPAAAQNVQQGPASSSSPPAEWTDYSTSFFYPVFNNSASAGGGTASGNLICTPGVIPQKMTLAGLSANITTLSAGGNVQLAIYSSVNGRPSTLIANTGSISTAATGFVTGTFASGSGSSVQVGPGGAQGGASLWFCSNRDNATVVMTPVDILAPSAGGNLSKRIGSATTANIVGVAGVTYAIFVSQTFGTWPSLAAASWTDVSTRLQPNFYFQPASIP